MASEKEQAGVSYERKDMRLRVVVGMLVLAACVVVSVFFGIWWFYWGEERSQRAAKGSTEALAPVYPAEPRLEEIDKIAREPGSNVNQRLAAQEAALDSYGPTEEKGFVHIPIQQAIEAVADKLPVRKQPPDRATNNRGPTDGGASNSGRTIRGEP